MEYGVMAIAKKEWIKRKNGGHDEETEDKDDTGAFPVVSGWSGEISSGMGIRLGETL